MTAKRNSSGAQMALKILVLACLVVSAFGAFFQLSDVHIDPDYKTGADPVERCVNMTENSEIAAGPYGQLLCDTPVALFSVVLNAMLKVDPNPDFILYSGDSAPHYLDYSSVQFYNKSQVLEANVMVLDMLRKAFPNTPIYPALGNHDNWLSDQLPQPPAATEWLDEIAYIWDPFVPHSALSTIRYGGYYTAVIRPGLRLVVFNSAYCEFRNLWAVLNQTEHAEQFQWMRSVLTAARNANEKVYIMGHMVPTDYFKFCRRAYMNISVEFQDVIVAHFYGDRHLDEFRVMVKDGVPHGILYVMPSVVPFTNHNPMFRQYTYNPSTYDLEEAISYMGELGDGEKPPQFAEAYKAREAYNMPDLSPASWLGAYNLIKNNQTVRQDFMKRYVQYGPRKSTSAKESLVVEAQVWNAARDQADEAPAKELDNLEAKPMCIVCRLAMTVIDTMLQQNATIDRIVNELVGVCEKQPFYNKRVCVGLCQMYGPYALPVLAKQGNAKRLCDAMELCKPESPEDIGNAHHHF